MATCFADRVLQALDEIFVNYQLLYSEWFKFQRFQWINELNIWFNTNRKYKINNINEHKKISSINTKDF